ncbi:DUF4296 domain-containing protein [Dyadobacter subterraneus]|uniref:DUF4296 domain-containing protein n=1 Tax=Dyadobacter subterraneus TaxID=2773304 RepID=A0ABR9WKB2_9BACT|nr:DUF4296 domain-containing protein [Dyadobacter subterraneus]MBE9465956.1 DUF4296 domain-containing protein [Dyadobacter subterraneus]
MTRRIINFSFSLILVGSITMIFAGCYKEETPPDGTLSEEKMADILTDIHIAESRVTRLQLKSLDSSILIFDQLKQEVWKKNKVDTLVYKNSYSFYMTHPQYMTRIYENVVKQIEQREKTKNIKP